MQQISVLERQHLLAVAPYVMIGLSSKAEMMKRINDNPSKVINVEDGEDLATKAAASLKELAAEKRTMYYYSLTNPTSKLALDVEVYLYCSKNKNFLGNDGGMTALGEKETENEWLVDDPSDQKAIIEEARHSYGEIYGINKDLFDYSKESYVIIFFRDIEQAVYCIKRGFVEEADDSIIMRRPHLRTLT
jgi:hypothetical protein